MKRFSNILFVDTTDSDYLPVAIDEAALLAGANGAKLTLHRVVEEAPATQMGNRVDEDGPTVEEILKDLQVTRLQRFAAALGDMEVTIEVDVGSPPVEIVRRVMRDGHDLVLLTTDGSESSSATVRRVLRLCPCSVWVMRPNAVGKRVLAAINPDDEPDLNRSILELAQSQAARTDGELHIVHSWEPYGYASLRAEGSPVAGSAGLATYASAAEAAHHDAFEATLAAAGVASGAARHLVDGPPQQAIIGLIRLYRIDLLVMGAGGGSDNDRNLVGNTAEQLFNSVESSVLVVKPPGFVSPVMAR